MVNIRKLENELWESADLLRAGSKLTSNQYCMPVEASDFAAKSALFLPGEAQYEYLVNLPNDISAAGLVNNEGQASITGENIIQTERSAFRLWYMYREAEYEKK